MQQPGFLRWWGGELAGMLPGWARGAPDRGLAMLRFRLSRDEMVVQHTANGKTREIGRFPRGRLIMADTKERAPLVELLRGLDPKRTGIVAHLAPELVLTKIVALPLAAEENLRQVLTFEMERQTPFRSDEVYFDYRVLERDTSALQLQVELSVAHRNVVEEARALVEGWVLEPGTALATSTLKDTATGNLSLNEEEKTLSVTFLPSGQQNKSNARVPHALLIVNTLLLIAVVAIPIARQKVYLAELRAQIPEVREQAFESSKIEERIVQFTEASRGSSGRKLELPPMVELLNSLSVMLPDSTWLNRIETKRGRIDCAAPRMLHLR